MRTVGDMKLTSFDEFKDEILGKVGTTRRDDHERSVEEAIKKVSSKNTTEEEI